MPAVDSIHPSKQAIHGFPPVGFLLACLSQRKRVYVEKDLWLPFPRLYGIDHVKWSWLAVRNHPKSEIPNYG